MKWMELKKFENNCKTIGNVFKVKLLNFWELYPQNHRRALTANSKRFWFWLLFRGDIHIRKETETSGVMESWLPIMLLAGSQQCRDLNVTPEGNSLYCLLEGVCTPCITDRRKSQLSVLLIAGSHNWYWGADHENFKGLPWPLKWQ